MRRQTVSRSQTKQQPDSDGKSKVLKNHLLLLYLCQQLELEARPPKVSHGRLAHCLLEAVRGLQDDVARTLKAVPLVRRQLHKERPEMEGRLNEGVDYCISCMTARLPAMGKPKL